MPHDEHRMNIWHGEQFPTVNTADDGYHTTCPVIYSSEFLCSSYFVIILVFIKFPFWSRAVDKADKCLHITVWTVVQAVLTATFNSYGDRQISTPPHKINTPEPIDKKFGTVDYVREGTLYTKFDTNPLTGASRQMGEI